MLTDHHTHLRPDDDPLDAGYSEVMEIKGRDRRAVPIG